MNIRHTTIVILWVLATGASSYAVHTHRADMTYQYEKSRNDLTRYVNNFEKPYWIISSEKSIQNSVKSVRGVLSSAKEGVENFATQTMASWLEVPAHKTASSYKMPEGFINASYSYTPPPRVITITEMKKRNANSQEADKYAQLMPAAGLAAPLWAPDEPSLDVEAVLVPRQVTVISSSQDGRIASIPVSHGDSFKKGDLLVAYDCSNIRAEADIATLEKGYTAKRLQGSESLFKLDIISDIDRTGARMEDQKARIKTSLYHSRLKDCDIRAEFDGHVTNRLANPGEYTRTDRVLLEVASEEPLQAEFLVPSKWLRWVNIGAPISITISETEKTYTAKISRIHGEVDPVSQSIQMIATLDNYQDPLMPGMSGKATIKVDDIRNAGISGYLEVNTSSVKR